MYTDSLKQVDYNYVFPFLGQGAYSQGFDIPYPLGIMGNYMWIDQELEFSNLQLGIKSDSLDIPLTDVGFIEFGENRNTSYTVNVRPDIWVLPFLNVYGIFGVGGSRTEVNLSAPVNLKSVVEQDIRTAGFGVMAALGIGPVWTSVDANWTWNKPQLLDKAVRVNAMGIRMGHTFVFKQHPDRNFALWIGGMRIKMNSETSGNVTLAEALPPETLERKDEIVSNYYDWYENEATIGQKLAADKVLTPIVERMEDANWDAVIRYAMDKQVKERWNGVIGAQFQFSKRWMIRSEAGLVGDRKSYLISLNYRFLGFKKG